MSTFRRMATVCGLTAVALCGLWRWSAADEHEAKPKLDAAAIGKAAGTEATEAAGGVVRIGWARDDVKVTVDGMPLHPFAGLGSWAAFMPTDHGAMVMGDTVVFQDEVTPAMDAAFAHGLEVSALHNHFFFDEPKVYFMHVGGEGEPEKLASGVKAVWAAIKTVRKEQPEPATRFGGETPRPGRIDAEAIGQILGGKPEVPDRHHVSDRLGNRPRDGARSAIELPSPVQPPAPTCSHAARQVQGSAGPSWQG